MNQQITTFEPETSLVNRSDFLLSDYHENGIHTSLGFYGETYIQNLIIKSGYSCIFTALERHCGDLRTLDTYTGEILQIEVKTAYISYKGHYNFCLRKQNHTDVTYSDFVVLLCIDKHLKHYTYIIPSSLVGTQSLTISSHPTKYKGKYSSFIQLGQISFDESRTVAELW